MDCSEAEERLHLWLDDELDEKERRELRAHLAECGECARKLAEYKQLGALLDQIDARTVVPAGLHRRIMEAVDRESAPAKGGARRWTRWAASAAAVLLLGVCVGVLWRGGVWPGPMGKSAAPYEMEQDQAAAPMEAPAAEAEASDAMGKADDRGVNAEEPAPPEENFAITGENTMEATWTVDPQGGDHRYQSGVSAIESFCAENGLTVLETGDTWIMVQWENGDGKQALLDFLEENGELVFEDRGPDIQTLRINIQ